MRILRALQALLFTVCASSMLAQSSAPSITSIDPPEWWAAMPAPMLLVHGQHLQGSTFTMSGDAGLRVSSTRISENGHWAVVRLAGAPRGPEAVRLTASAGSGKIAIDYHFGPRRAADDGLAGFSSRDVMYLIMTDRFADGDPANDGPDHAAQLALPRGWHGGDFRGVADHLDYLETLGITTVWITPVYQNHEAQSYHGYGATDLYAVDEHFGTLADLQQLAAQIHKRQMKLVLDTVPNHVGPEHPWVEDEPEPDWFHGTRANHHKAVGEFAPLVDPHAPWRDQQDILEGWFADKLPDMNQENRDAADYLTQNAIWWVEQTGADGLRIDTFPYVARPFWHEFHARLHALYPRLTTVGEVYNGNPVITSAFAGGVVRSDLQGGVDTGLTTPFDFPTYFALRDVLLHGAPMTKLAEVLRQDSLYPHPERLVPFLGNHDTKRFLSEEGATPARLQLAFALILTMRGTPQVYSGDEIAMTGGEDPDNRRDFPGGFGPGTPSAFVAAQQTPAQQEMYKWVQRLLQMRARYPELSVGEEQVLAADKNVLLAVRGSDLREPCGAGRGRILLAINKGDTAQTMDLVTDKTALEGCAAPLSLLGQAQAAATVQGARQLTVPPGASLLYWAGGVDR